MSEPGPATEILGRIAFEFALFQPYLPTYAHLLISALFPIYTGAHASLSPPSSAATPLQRKKTSSDEDNDDDDDEDEDGRDEETHQKMEGLSPSDAIMFPLLAGSTLTGLYFIIKWLQDPALLNLILNWYFSIFGTISVARLFTDTMTTVSSFVFPARYSNNGLLWEAKSKERIVKTRAQDIVSLEKSLDRTSPLPGLLSKLALPPTILNTLWYLRELPMRRIRVRAYVRDLGKVNFRVGPQGFTSLFLAVAAVLYFNLVDKPWFLTNLLGFSLSYGALQIMSPTTFWTGTLILSSLFAYDIYFVFFTPIMVTVATKLDIPAKLLFPRPPGPKDDPERQALAMLGLGDIVLPGIMIGLALRFDLYLFYLRKQTRRSLESASPATSDEPEHTGELEESPEANRELMKPPFHPATGAWGDRFWLNHHHNSSISGRLFPKPYFHASLVGYVAGMICTLGVMHGFGHAQPALLYLVPGVLGSLWGTAFVKGDLKAMWEYNESVETEVKETAEEDEGNAKKDEKSRDEGRGFFSLFRSAAKSGTAPKSPKKAPQSPIAPAKTNSTPAHHSQHPSRELLFFSLTLPPRISETSKSTPQKAVTPDLAQHEDHVDTPLQCTLGEAKPALGPFDGPVKRRKLGDD
ncbi:hypothetical protein MMC12_007479 [Toensbergia leucococca]|nr:hypothetical protein [Toensbergia leucococca]